MKKEVLIVVFLFLAVHEAVSAQQWKKGCYLKNRRNIGSPGALVNSARQCTLICQRQKWPSPYAILNKTKAPKYLCYCSLKVSEYLPCKRCNKSSCHYVIYFTNMLLVENLSLESPILLAKQNITSILLKQDPHKKPLSMSTLRLNVTDNGNLVPVSQSSDVSRLKVVFELPVAEKHNVCISVMDITGQSIHKCWLVIPVDVGGEYFPVPNGGIAVKTNSSLSFLFNTSITISSLSLSIFSKSFQLGKKNGSFANFCTAYSCNITFLNHTGVYSITISAFDKNNSKIADLIDKEDFIVVQDPVKKICLKTSNAFINISKRFEAVILGPKEHVKYEWIFGKRKTPLVTYVPYCNYTVRKGSLLNVIVNASNFVSSISSEFSVAIEILLSAVKIIAPPNPLLVGQAVKLHTNLGDVQNIQTTWYVKTKIRFFSVIDAVHYFTPKVTGKVEVKLKVTANGKSGNASLTLYVLKKIDPFELNYELKGCKEVAVYGNIDVVELEARFFHASYDPIFFWNFGDGSKIEDTKKPFITHLYETCDESRKYITMNASNIVSSYKSRIAVYIQQEVCNVQIYFPWKYLIVKIFKLSDTIHLQPAVNISCPLSTNVTYEWKINSSSESNSSKFDRSFGNQRSPQFKATDLGVGKFPFYFEVSTTKSVTRNYFGEFEIVRSGLKAVISNGGFHIVNPLRLKQIDLNGSGSYDIDDPGSKQDLRYEWKCYTEAEHCFKSNFSVNLLVPILFLKRSDLINVNKFVFVLKVSKDGLPTVNATVFYRFVEERDPLLYDVQIKCESCQDDVQSAAKKTVFSIKAPPLPDNINLKWKVFLRRQARNIFGKHLDCMPTKWPRDYSLAVAGTNKSSMLSTSTSKQVSKQVQKPPQSCNFSMESSSNKQQKQALFTAQTNTRLKAFGGAAYNKSNLFSNGVTATDMPSITTVSAKTYVNARSGSKLNYFKSHFAEYFDLHKTFFRRTTEDYPNGMRRRKFVIQSKALVPASEFVITVTMSDTNGRTVGRGNMIMKANPAPAEGRCEVMRSIYGEELTTWFKIKCNDWKSKYPLVYNLHAYNPSKGVYDLVLVSKKYMFTFVLPYNYNANDTCRNNGTKVLLRVTVSNTFDDALKLCDLKACVSKNPKINMQYLYDQAKDRQKLTKFYEPYQTLNIVSALSKKLNNLPLSNESILTREELCRTVQHVLSHEQEKNETKVSIQMLVMVMKLLTLRIDQISGQCMSWILREMHRLSLTENRALYQQSNAGSIKRGQYTFANYVFDVLQGMFAFYKRKKQHNEMNYVIVLQRAFLKQIAHEHFSSETYAQYHGYDAKLLAQKISTTKQKLHVNGIKVVVDSKGDELETCYDVALVAYNGGKNWLSEKNIEKCDVQVADCSEIFPRNSFFHSISMPVYSTQHSFGLHWERINAHVFNITKARPHIYIKMMDTSKNSEHFTVFITLRSTANDDLLRNLSYPTDCDDQDCSFYVNQFSGPGAYVLSLEILYPYEKVVAKPWYNYSLSINEPHCQSWDKKFKPSLDQACSVSPQTTFDRVTCRCSKSSLISAYMEPLSYMSENRPSKSRKFGTLLPIFVVLTIMVIYLLLVLWKWQSWNSYHETVIKLPENHPCDNYKYSILIETGHMYNAGTTARVCAILHGTKAHSEKLELSVRNMNMFMRTSTDMILVSCPQHLGALTHIVLWHNNKGISPDWYIKQVAIKDVMTDSVSYFPFHNWLSLKKGIRSTSCRLIATENNCQSRVQLMFEKIMDYHLWLSALAGPLQTPFSSFERMSCLLAQIILYFVTTLAVFHGDIHENELLLGLLHISSSRTVVIAFLVVFGLLPVKIVLTCAYRNSTLLIDARRGQKQMRRKMRRRNKIFDVSQLQNDVQEFEMKQLGAMYYNQVLDDQLSLASLSSKRQDQPHLRDIEIPVWCRTIALFVTFMIVSLGIVYVVWKSLFLYVNLLTAWMQLVILCIFVDVFVASFIGALVTTLFSMSVTFSGDRYEYLFQIMYTRLRTQKVDPCTQPNVKTSEIRDGTSFINYIEPLKRSALPYADLIIDYLAEAMSYPTVQPNLKALDVRDRARFIRYAQPVNKCDVRKKQLKLEKQEQLKKIWLKILILLLLAFASIGLVIDESVTEIHLSKEYIRQNLNVENIRTRKDFWEWSEKMIPSLINYERWHWKRSHREEDEFVNLRPLGRSTLSNAQEYVVLQGSNKRIRQILLQLQKDDWFHVYVDQVSYEFSLVSILNGNPIYSVVKIDFNKHHTGAFIPTVQVESVQLECPLVGNRTLSNICQALLLSLFIIMVIRTYNKFLQKAWTKLLTSSTIINLLLLFSAGTASLACVVESIAEYYMRSLLSGIEFDDHGDYTLTTYINVNAIVVIKKFLLASKGILLFLVCIKSLSLLKLIRVTYYLMKQMKKALINVSSHLVFIAVLILGLSHVWYLLYNTSSAKFKSYYHVLQHVTFNLPRLLTSYEDIRYETSSEFYLFLTAFCSCVAWFFVKMSFIYFIGKFGHKMMASKRNMITIWWLVKKGWRYLSENFHQRKKQRYKYRRSNQLPKKFVLDEIDYQLEEMLYRVKKLAESENVYDSDSSDSYLETSSYYADESNTSTYPDRYSCAPNTDLSHTLTTLKSNASVIRKTAQINIHDGSKLKTNAIPLESPGISRRASGGVFKRFSLASIIENSDSSVINDPIRRRLPVIPPQYANSPLYQSFAASETDHADKVNSDVEIKQTLPVGTQDIPNDITEPVMQQIDKDREFKRISFTPTKLESSYARTVRIDLERKLKSRKTLTPQEAERRLHLLKDEEKFADIHLNEKQQRFDASLDSGCDITNHEGSTSNTNASEAESPLVPSKSRSYKKALERANINQEVLEAERRNLKIYKSIEEKLGKFL